MKNNLYFLIIHLAGAIALSACAKDTPDEDNPSKATKGIITGRVADAQNKPLKDAKVTVEHTVWYNNYLFGTSDNDGKFQVSIPNEPAGDWTAKAQLTRTAYGQVYTFDLKPDKTDAFRKEDGAVRNFKWLLSGERPGHTGYYGAHVDLYQFATDIDMAKLKIVFSPYPGEPQLIDGTTAVAFESPITEVAGTYMVRDVPVGKYTIKASYPGKKILLNNRHEDDANEESKTVVFGKYGFLGETEYNIEFYITE